MPLLSIAISPTMSEDRHPDARNLLPQPRIRNPYQRSFVVIMSVMGILVVMCAFQEIVLGIGISGCGRDSLHQEECEGFTFMFITAPLMFRQVTCSTPAQPRYAIQLKSECRVCLHRA